MKYLLDTDHISVLQKQSGADFARLTGRMTQYAPSDIVLSVISYHEQVLGCQTYLSRAQKPVDLVRGYAMLWQVHADFSMSAVLPFDSMAAAIYANLLAQRVRIGSMDLRIAAIALSRGLVLVTRNARDFGKVPGLAMADWTT